jgi:5-methyltetrahydropteroyltriglutamate--homocysteine methyltransferase
VGLETTLIGGYPKIGDSTEEQIHRRSLHQFDKGNLSEEELEQVKNDVTKLAIQKQVDAGIDIVTDGRIRWDDAVTYQARKMAGFDITGLIRYFDTNTFYRQPVAESRVEAIKPLLVNDYQFATQNSSKPVKVVITGPFTMAKLCANHFYREPKQFVFDLAHIFHAELTALEEAGCTQVQFDEPALLQHKDEFNLFVQAYEVVTAQRSKAERTLFLNFGAIDEIYPKVLGLPFDRIGLDLTAGHANWNVITKEKWSKKLLAGVIDARNTKMESESAITQLVNQVGEVISLDNVWLSHNHNLEFLPRVNADQKINVLTKVAKQLKGASVS